MFLIPASFPFPVLTFPKSKTVIKKTHELYPERMYFRGAVLRGSPVNRMNVDSNFAGMDLIHS